jgi:hypothetical protein
MTSYLHFTKWMSIKCAMLAIVKCSTQQTKQKQKQEKQNDNNQTYPIRYGI